ncbi:hypothetical protein Mgra_00007171 [Meloidogyne graminicola]|uniref:7TM_GPCR_Srx domain-containing protein n=1 Tax=Meloidogyne graminicola TaxID=189291 RepID=A0A8S9ZK03_9BILA|nr:hypothetical protein Mgra_00007171 [Meloidogyne graminicola]
MIYCPSMNPGYLSLKNTGIQIEFFEPAISFYITIKYRNKYSTLGSKTAILIIINSFFEILHQSGHFLFIFISGSGINFIPFKKAILFHIHSIIGFYSSLLMINTLSFDRLLSALLPIFYNNIKQTKYICIHFIIIITLNCYVIIRIILTVNNLPEWPVNGSVADSIGMISYSNSPFIFVPSLICYLIVGLIIKFRTVITNIEMKKLYRSLFLIIFINAGGYMFGIGLIYFNIQNIIKNQFIFIQFGILIGLILNIASSSNAPILIINSNDYRNAYKKEFTFIKQKIFKLFSINQQIKPTIVTRV